MLKISNVGGRNVNIAIGGEPYTLYPQYKLFIKNNKIDLIENLDDLLSIAELVIVTDDTSNLPQELIPCYSGHAHITDESMQIFGTMPNIGIADQHNCAIKPVRVGNSEPVNYGRLTEKPQINGITLLPGNNTSDVLGLVKSENYSSGGLRQGGSGLSDYNYTETDKEKVNAMTSAAIANINMITSKVDQEWWSQQLEDGTLVESKKVLSERDFTNDLYHKLSDLPVAGDEKYKYTSIKDLLEGTQETSLSHYRSVGGLPTGIVSGNHYTVNQVLELIPSNDNVTIFKPVKVQILSVSADNNQKIESVAVLDSGLFLTNDTSIVLKHVGATVSSFTFNVVTSTIEVPKYSGKLDKDALNDEFVKNVQLVVEDNQVDGDDGTVRLQISKYNPITGETENILDPNGIPLVDKNHPGLMPSGMLDRLDTLEGSMKDIEDTYQSFGGYSFEEGSVEFSSSEFINADGIKVYAYSANTIGNKDSNASGTVSFSLSEATDKNDGLLTSENLNKLKTLDKGNISIANKDSVFNILKYSDNGSGETGLSAIIKPVYNPKNATLTFKDKNDERITDMVLYRDGEVTVNSIHLDQYTLDGRAQNKLVYGVNSYGGDSGYISESREFDLPMNISANPAISIVNTLKASELTVNVDDTNTTLNISDRGITLGAGTTGLLGAIKSDGRADIRYPITITDTGYAEVSPSIAVDIDSKLNHNLGDTDETRDALVITDSKGEITVSDKVFVRDIDKLIGIADNLGDGTVKDSFDNIKSNIYLPANAEVTASNNSLAISLTSLNPYLNIGSDDKQVIDTFNIPLAQGSLSELGGSAGIITGSQCGKLDSLPTREEYDRDMRGKLNVDLSETVISKVERTAVDNLDVHVINTRSGEITVNKIYTLVPDANDKFITVANVDGVDKISSNISITVNAETNSIDLMGVNGVTDSIKATGLLCEFDAAGKSNIKVNVNESFDIVDNKISLNTATDLVTGGIKLSKDEFGVSVDENGIAIVTGLVDKLKELTDTKQDIAIGKVSKVLVTNEDGAIAASEEISVQELNTLNGINTEKTIQEQLDNRVTKQMADKDLVYAFDDSSIDSTADQMAIKIRYYNPATESTGDNVITLASAKNEPGNTKAGVMSFADKYKLDNLPEAGDETYKTTTLKELLAHKVAYEDYGTNGAIALTNIEVLNNAANGLTLQQVKRDLRNSQDSKEELFNIPVINAVDKTYGFITGKDWKVIDSVRNAAVNDIVTITGNVTVNESTITIPKKEINLLTGEVTSSNKVISLGTGLKVTTESPDSIHIETTTPFPELPSGSADGAYQLVARKVGNSISYVWELTGN